MIKEIKKYNKDKQERIQAITTNDSVIFDSLFDKESVKVIQDLLEFEKISTSKDKNKFEKKMQKLFGYFPIIFALIGASTIVANPSLWFDSMYGFVGASLASSLVLTTIEKNKNKKFDEKLNDISEKITEANRFMNIAPERDEKIIDEIIKQNDISDNVLMSVKEEEWSQPVIEKPKTLKRKK